MIKLREIAKVTAGQAAPKEFADEGYPFIRAGHLEGLLSNLSLNDIPKVSEEVAQKKRLKKIPKGTILFAKSGMSATKNRVYITERESYFVSHLAGILPSERFSNSYLARFLSWYNPSKLILDAAYPSIRLEDINNLSIPLPPLLQQKKIAAILDAADEYRQKTKALIAKYDELTQSLFLDMFGAPVTNPKGFELSKLGLLVENKDSKRVPVKSSDRDNMNGQFPYYGASGIIDYVDDFTHEGNNLLIGEDGANLLARSTPIAFIAKGQYWVNNHAHVLGYNGKALLVFLEFFINLIDLSPYVSGSAQPKLNRKNMDQIKVFCPPLELQNQFADRVQAIEAQKAQAQESLAKAEDLFNSLLQKAFKGELTS